jgi:hypothetical protein
MSCPILTRTLRSQRGQYKRGKFKFLQWLRLPPLPLRNYMVWDWGFRHTWSHKNWSTASRGEMKNGNMYAHKQMYATTTLHACTHARAHKHIHTQSSDLKCLLLPFAGKTVDQKKLHLLKYCTHILIMMQGNRHNLFMYHLV